MTGRRNASIEQLWAHPRGRIGVVLLAFAAGVTVAAIFTDTEKSSSDIVVVVGAMRFPALVLGFILVMTAAYRFRAVHWAAAAVALVCAGLQALVSLAQGFEQRSLEADVDGPAGWAFILLVVAALVPLMMPAERLDAPAEEEDAPAEAEPSAEEAGK